jgi:hypothetical protein
MKKILLISLVFISFSLRADWGLWDATRSYIVINENGTQNTYSLWDAGSGTFQNHDFGIITEGEAFTLISVDTKTWKNGDSDVTGCNYYYVIYPFDERPENPVFTDLGGGFLEDLRGGNQKWGIGGLSTNLLAGLEGGKYTLEIYGRVSGTNPTEFKYDNNNNSNTNYTAHFTYVDLTSSDGDGDWNTISWTGDNPDRYSNVTIDNLVNIPNSIDIETHNITISNDAALTINPLSSLTLFGNLNIPSTKSSRAIGQMLIKSSSSGTGSLIVNGTVTGNVTVERYLTNYDNSTDAKYHFISSPVSIQAIQPEFVTDPPTAGVDFYKFDEATNTWINSKVSGGAWNSGFENNFVVGRGYLVAYPTAPVTKAFSGTLNNNASYVLTCTYTDGQGNGWNLLGNPYPAAIDWNSVTLGDGVDNALYYYDASTQNYIAYLRISGDNSTSTGGSQYIPAGQGFMVHANNTGSTKTVTIEKADLTHTGQDVYYKSSTNLLAGSLSLQITGNNFSDQTIIHFNEQASTDFDGNYDAFKLMSANIQVPMIYTENEENTQFAINGLPQVEEGTSIPVSLRIGADGTYTIEANINEIETNIFLEDLFTGTSTKLNETSSYSFTASENDNPNRFLLHFGMVGVGEQEQASTLQAYVVDNRLYVNNSLEQAQLAVYDLQGRLVAEQSLNSGGLQSLPLDLPAGVYIVRLNNASESRAVKINVQ